MDTRTNQKPWQLRTLLQLALLGPPASATFVILAGAIPALVSAAIHAAAFAVTFDLTVSALIVPVAAIPGALLCFWLPRLEHSNPL